MNKAIVDRARSAAAKSAAVLAETITESDDFGECVGAFFDLAESMGFEVVAEGGQLVVQTGYTGVFSEDYGEVYVPEGGAA